MATNDLNLNTPITTLARRLQRISRAYDNDIKILINEDMEVVLAYEAHLTPAFRVPTHAYEIRGEWNQRTCQDYLDSKTSDIPYYLEILSNQREIAALVGR